MRQHVNPLSRFFQEYIEIPSPSELFLNSHLPIHLDIGCARGRFLLDLSRIERNLNFLGIDIRSALVERAEKERINLDRDNLRFIFCNANISLENWLSKLSSYNLHRVSIQFPDPWFKKRHQKRRVFKKSLLISLASSMKPGSQLFFQSDVYTVIKPMLDLVIESELFDIRIGQDSIWLDNNPFDFPTERETYALENGLEVYRAMFYRNRKNI